jgi:hypothetical protein
VNFCGASLVFIHYRICGLLVENNPAHDRVTRFRNYDAQNKLIVAKDEGRDALIREVEYGQRLRSESPQRWLEGFSLGHMRAGCGLGVLWPFLGEKVSMREWPLAKEQAFSSQADRCLPIPTPENTTLRSSFPFPTQNNRPLTHLSLQPSLSSETVWCLPT